MTSMEREGFYEDDEPLEDLVAAYKAASKGVTAESSRGQTLYLDIATSAVRESGNKPAGRILDVTGDLHLHTPHNL